MHVAWLWAIAALGMVVLSGIRGPMVSPAISAARTVELLLCLAYCGGGSSVGGPQLNPNGTPAGTYTLTVKASSGSATEATSFTLTLR